uniref:zinc finger protein 585B-like n=1 Tax=Styela clava TaxID=7725 RepID=UPI00193AD4C4|nr:zinc finger protein 585B-like [Styela clava]
MSEKLFSFDGAYSDTDQKVETSIDDGVFIITVSDNKNKITQRAEYTRLKVRLPRVPPFSCPCENCGKIFETHERLRSHYRHNHGEKRYKCNECPLRFLYPRDLRSHQRTHTGEKPFICDTCGKRFSQMSAVTIHMKTHKKDKSEDVTVHPCLVCKRQYVSKDDKTTSFDINNYDMSSLVCPNGNCAKKFASIKSLRKHINNDICNMRQLQCSECKIKFGTMRLMRQHIVTEHCKHTYKKKIKKSKVLVTQVAIKTGEQVDAQFSNATISDMQKPYANLQSHSTFLLDSFPSQNANNMSALPEFGDNVELGSEIVMGFEED